MLTAENLYVQGRHSALHAPTSLMAEPGDILLVQADGASARTSLALTLSGRMKPTSGSLHWNGDSHPGLLRRRSALVDSPEVNEPELHLRVKDLVAEDLALIPRAERPKASPARWLEAMGFGSSGDLWIEQVPAYERIRLLTALALADSRIDLLVLDSPDRHQGDPGAWLPALKDAVAAAADAPGEAGRTRAGRNRAGRNRTEQNSGARDLAVVAVVAQLPPWWSGPAAQEGNAAAPAAPPLESADESGVPAPADASLTATPDSAETEVTA
ncbi:ABC transporter ATP-binding protein [Arthrobacter gengyunqii]|uniref:ABC transporter ATP-binding protein n=1 Tax=Arthrobacter gengyunqii TaxID=2886940 RepID=A0ABS8GNQ7_9MICC|nr:ABC transporter ATP-binding protein [Arthrobacter gengyunqii]MCC3267491.1 ABC transporter ATP-binding protein [Arthrobacter gengyunqii]